MDKVSCGFNMVMEKMRRSLAMKIVVLGVILLVLLIPLAMTSGLRQERQERAAMAAREVSSHWGEEAYLMAPVLTRPFVFERKNEKTNESFKSTSMWHIRPETLKIECDVTPEIRYRGIYQIILYKATAHLKGSFVVPAHINENVDTWLSNENTLDFFFKDTKGVEKVDVQIQGHPLKIASAGSEIFSFALSEELSASADTTIDFTAEITYKGHEKLMFFPNASDFELKIKSPWQHPSFCGDLLPTERTISENGFEASWILGTSTIRRHTHSWKGSLQGEAGPWDEYFGVSLKLPADAYVQVDRVTNYAFFVMAIVLIAFLMGEILTKIWVHPFQYFFVGLSLVMFYMLLLALAEHMNFTLSYAISALAIASMTTAYGRMIFAGKNASAFVLGGIILLAYAMIFVLTRLEDYALLVGSVIMLGLLGVMMAFTGHLNRPCEKATESREEKE